MTKKKMTDNIIKVFGRNHSEELIVKFYYDEMIKSEKENIKKQIEKLQKRLDELNEM